MLQAATTDRLMQHLGAAGLMAVAIAPPDPWQEALLEDGHKHVLLLCARQSGKTSVVATLAAHRALHQPAAEIIIVSSTQAQASEVLRRIRQILRVAELRYSQRSVQRIELANGARILALSSSEQSVRGYSGVSLLIIDEAARVPDELYYALTPMLAISQGDLYALSTPFGARGWFWQAWAQDREDAWHRVTVTADECPRLTPEFLAEERRRMGELWYRQEYDCQFVDATHSVFGYDLIQSLVRDDLEVTPWQVWI